MSDNYKLGSQTEIDGLLEELIVLKEQFVKQCAQHGAEQLEFCKHHQALLSELATQRSQLKDTRDDFVKLRDQIGENLENKQTQLKLSLFLLVLSIGFGLGTVFWAIT